MRLIESWYDNLGAALAGAVALPAPVVESPTFDPSLLDEVDNHLRVAVPDGATAVRLIWTKDYLGVARRLEETLIEAARSAVRTVTPDSATTPSANEVSSTT